MDTYVNVYKWFTGTSGMAIGERVEKIVSPSAPKNEADLAETAGKWIEAKRNPASTKAEYQMATPSLFVAHAMR